MVSLSGGLGIASAGIASKSKHLQALHLLLPNFFPRLDWKCQQLSGYTGVLVLCRQRKPGFFEQTGWLCRQEVARH